jgi:predicted dehydrogenase
MEKVRVGIIGAGGMGRGHGARIHSRPEAQVTALCDTSEQALKSAKERIFPGGGEAPTYSDWREMLAQETLDAAVVSTPHTQHYEQVKGCLGKGLHVLVEKPMTTKAAHARELMGLAESKGKKLAIAYQRHSSPVYRLARQIVHDGTIGEVKFISALIAQDCRDNFARPESWRSDPELSGGGHFMDTGSHVVDIILWISGLRPAEVHAFVDNTGLKVDILTAVAIKFDNGALGTFAATGLSPEWREELSFYGANGVLNLRGDGFSYQARGGDVIMPRQFPFAGTSPADNFIDAICGKEEVLAPPICGVRVAELTESAYESARTGAPVKVS